RRRNSISSFKYACQRNSWTTNPVKTKYLRELRRRNIVAVLVHRCHHQLTRLAQMVGYGREQGVLARNDESLVAPRNIRAPTTPRTRFLANLVSADGCRFQFAVTLGAVGALWR
ncbi:MAG: hypothetical protein M1282_05305, partial [Chloroflexi bacterium]|nr:hypothetical protein [Chloroflexota bacterium]